MQCVGLSGVCEIYTKTRWCLYALGKGNGKKSKGGVFFEGNQRYLDNHKYLTTKRRGLFKPEGMQIKRTKLYTDSGI